MRLISRSTWVSSAAALARALLTNFSPSMLSQSDRGHTADPFAADWICVGYVQLILETVNSF